MYYQQYPDNIVYQFNDLGFRDVNSSQYQGNEILALGDSFTLGIGVNVEQTWPYVLQNLLAYPVRNFSLNGASNDWMARKLKVLLNFFNPRLVVIHYSFSHRRERPHNNWQDHERTESEPVYTQEQNISNWVTNYNIINNIKVPVIHSFITDWDPMGVDYKNMGQNLLAPMQKIDLARDGFHYGVKTNFKLAENIANLTSLLAV
jgi:hypothetical protein